jgi:hypothetical protein
VKFDDEVKKQLDAVVGESYAPPRRWRATLGKWLAGAALAVATSALIMGILDKHVGGAKSHAVEQAASKPASKKAIPITVIPAQK